MDASNLLRMTELGNPWSFASYTDEAMEIIAGSRIGLRRWLEQGLTHKQLGYWLGRPEGTGRGVFDRLVSRRSRNLLTHDALNCPEFLDKFPRLLKKECVVWASRVAYPRQPPMSLGLQQLYIEGWDDFDKVKRLTFPRGTFILLDCGPTGTALAWHWYFRNPRCTVIDMQGVWYAAPSSSPVVDLPCPTD